MSPVFHSRNITVSGSFSPTHNYQAETESNQQKENLSNSLLRNTEEYPNEAKVASTADADKEFKPARQNSIPVMNFIEYLDKTKDKGNRREKTKMIIKKKRKTQGQNVVRKPGGRMRRVLGNVAETAVRAVEGVLGRAVAGQENIVKRRRGREKSRISVYDSILTFAISSGIVAAILGT